MRRVLSLLTILPLAAALLHAPPTHAQGVIAFSGTAIEDCYGCGLTNGRFWGTLTGVVNGHLYSSAPVTIDYFTENPAATCPIIAIGYGAMRVSDGAQSNTWYLAWTRAYADTMVISFTGDGSGVGASTYVVTNPVGTGCGQQNVVIDMRGTAVLA